MKKRITSVLLLVCLAVSLFSLCSCKTIDELKAKTGIIGKDGTISHLDKTYVPVRPADSEDLYLSRGLYVIGEDDPLLLAEDIGTYSYTSCDRTVIEYGNSYYCLPEYKEYLEKEPVIDRYAMTYYYGDFIILPEKYNAFITGLEEGDGDDSWQKGEEYCLYDWFDMYRCDENKLYAEPLEIGFCSGWIGDEETFFFVRDDRIRPLSEAEKADFADLLATLPLEKPMY